MWGCILSRFLALYMFKILDLQLLATWDFQHTNCICSLIHRYSIGRYFIIDRVAGAIIRLVVSMCLSFLSVGALLFEPFDL